MKIISGGQTGVDRAALRAAQSCGLSCGGWCPPGRLSESGRIPSSFPLQETSAERSVDALDIPRSQRTEWNVRDADALLILRPVGRALDPGTDYAAACAARSKKPCLVCDPFEGDADERIRTWLASIRPDTLNVAGPSEGTAPGIGERAYAVLVRAFRPF